jgi:hypothetical protein
MLTHLHKLVEHLEVSTIAKGFERRRLEQSWAALLSDGQVLRELCPSLVPMTGGLAFCASERRTEGDGHFGECQLLCPSGGKMRARAGKLEWGHVAARGAMDTKVFSVDQATDSVRRSLCSLFALGLQRVIICMRRTVSAGPSSECPSVGSSDH